MLTHFRAHLWHSHFDVRAALAVALLAVTTAPTAVFAYNDQQHQGVVAVAYKAMAEAVLEGGTCSAPIPFPGSTPPSLRSFPGGAECSGVDETTCRSRWQSFLDGLDRSVVYLRTKVNAGLGAPPAANCPDPRGTLMKDVVLGVTPEYVRNKKVCGIEIEDIHDAGYMLQGCSGATALCDARSVHHFIVPHDHTGDTLGYWATEPDHDDSVTGIGLKPTSAGGLGRTLDAANDILETAVFAVVAPIVCIADFLFGDGDCLKHARSLADDAVPIEEISSIIPVVLSQHNAEVGTGLWHFIKTNSPASNECDDLQGILYEEAGPGVPDAVDLAIIAITDLVGATVDYDDSTGTDRFAGALLKNPGDGDQPTCNRGRAEWEFQTFAHTPFGPIDNLGFWGWFNFTGDHNGSSVGWPLHALGDAVAPHHVIASTGWGHRPFEDAAEENWRAILHQDASDATILTLQYEQLRTILIWGFHYSQLLDGFRVTRPTGSPVNAIPLRALVTQVAKDTLAETLPDPTNIGWPFFPEVSVPYALAGQPRGLARQIYSDQASIDGQRAILERGMGSIVAFLSSTARLDASVSVPNSVCGVASTFGDCGPFAACAQSFTQPGCCLAIAPAPTPTETPLPQPTSTPHPTFTPEPEPTEEVIH